METNFKEYPIFKKRDGQGFNYESYIYAETFEEAKKEFAQNMTKDNWNNCNNIIWLEKEVDGVDVTGWYDLDSSIFGFTSPDNGDETEGEPIYSNEKGAIMELFCSEEFIKEGFDSWTEDVYTWELREPSEEE
jgi:hypothetical protein